MRRVLFEVCILLSEILAALSDVFFALSQKARGKALAALLLMLIAGCAPRVRMDVTCIFQPQAIGVIRADCADRQTWDEWNKEKEERVR